jgi:hypothetical protein
MTLNAQRLRRDRFVRAAYEHVRTAPHSNGRIASNAEILPTGRCDVVDNTLYTMVLSPFTPLSRPILVLVALEDCFGDFPAGT